MRRDFFDPYCIPWIQWTMPRAGIHLGRSSRTLHESGHDTGQPLEASPFVPSNGLRHMCGSRGACSEDAALGYRTRQRPGPAVRTAPGRAPGPGIQHGRGPSGGPLQGFGCLQASTGVMKEIVVIGQEGKIGGSRRPRNSPKMNGITPGCRWISRP
jgi:hypothetical protein